MPTAPFSNEFASYYDLLYSERGYREECDRIVNLIGQHVPAKKTWSILDMGCGSGSHSIDLAKRGHQVTGIDLDGVLIQAANQHGSTAVFEVGDVRSYHKVDAFDAIISMFGVLSYQIDTADLIRTFRTANRCLHDHGVFIFDFWNGNAVVKSTMPNGTLREISLGDRTIYKYTDVVPDGIHSNVAEIRFTIFDPEKGKVVKDSHRQRFFFMQEIKDQLSEAGFEIVNWNTTNLGLNVEDKNRLPWNISVVAIKERQRGWA